MSDKTRELLQQIATALHGIGDMLSAIDRGYETYGWVEIDRRGQTVREVFQELPHPVQKRLPTLWNGLRVGSSLHLIWSSCLDEVETLGIVFV